MPWVKLDDAFFDHPKIANLSDTAAVAFLRSICYANRNLTDGFIPMRKAREFAKRKAAAELAPSLWEVVEGGFRIHDYLDYQPSKSQVLAEREVARRRSAMNSNPQLSAAVRGRDGDLCRYCDCQVSFKDRKGPKGGTYDHVLPLSLGGRETVDNLVVCCRTCNNRKGARTPEQAGMTLLPRRNLDGITPKSRPPVPVPSGTNSQVPKDKPALTEGSHRNIPPSREIALGGRVSAVNPDGSLNRAELQRRAAKAEEQDRINGIRQF